MIKRGRIGDYHWGEFWGERPELALSDVVCELSSFLVGLFTMNTSFDSGRLGTEVGQLPTGWTMSGLHAVSPPLTDMEISAWPESGFGFDEWYFFHSLPTLESERVVAWCNYGYILQLDQWQIPKQFDESFDLSAQLDWTVPELVLGEGNSMYLLSRSHAVVETFLALTERP